VNELARGKTLRVADLFCGAGGTSAGLYRTAERLGLGVELLAINHWETAVETHAQNHPGANHLCASLDQVDPSKVVPDGKLDLLLASPECVHFSNARGDKPCNDQSRASAWHVLHWAERLRVESILLENVREFASWGPLGRDGRPVKSRRGETFAAWLAALRSLGYQVEYRLLNAADYGGATTRTRLFVMATRQHRGPRWPRPTHEKLSKEGLCAGDLLPWRPARTVIDWALPSESIFGRKRPLAEKTLARIEEGLRRFCGLTLEPFVLQQQGGGVARAVSQPLPTVATKGAISLVEPFLVPRYGEREGQRPRTHSLGAPMPTIPATCQHGLVEPFLVRYHGNGGAESVDRPLPTITTRDRFGLVQPMHLDIRLRMLQPHELAAAMSFPPGYRFAGTRSEVVKQIGNAVEVNTAAALCEAALGCREAT
jgi:DNA (cytosine-5)-methyltransferase 1